MYRFFTERQNIDEAAAKIRITGGDVSHIRSVLRMRPGEKVLLCETQSPGGTGARESAGGGRGEKIPDQERWDGWPESAGSCPESEYVCELENISSDEVTARILEKRALTSELPSRIVLFQGLPKADKLESIIQKSVELGVFSVIPVLMRRSVVRPDPKKAGRKTERFNAIARAAAMQSKRGIIPGVSETVSFPQAVRLAEKLDHVIVPYEDAEGIAHTKRVLAGIKPGESAGIFIGPEGGFEAEEVQMLKDAGGEAITLGHRILRTETAGPAILAILMMQLES